KPIVGASIVVVGTAVGTSSSETGQYSIQANQGSRISYSLVGKESATITTTSNTTINVTLNDANQKIEDVVVIAYGTAKKKDLTGAISTVDSKVLGAQANSTLTKALEGAVPGIQVSSVDGQPGVDMGVRVRGIGSSSQNNSNALIVIDGVPVTAGFNPLSTMNPKDIESVTILKDAASTALWGSRGANGVIMVTS
ncbi:SusC/RagA family TonB-linked outer membrane protein, partial [Escherichia coli]|nr:SusC/RagA family TonB-linked outer membrane protein [Escherichia coli]